MSASCPFCFRLPYFDVTAVAYLVEERQLFISNVRSLTRAELQSRNGSQSECPAPSDSEVSVLLLLSVPSRSSFVFCCLITTRVQVDVGHSAHVRELLTELLQVISEFLSGSARQLELVLVGWAIFSPVLLFLEGREDGVEKVLVSWRIVEARGVSGGCYPHDFRSFF